MKIFYIKKDNFLKNFNKVQLNSFLDKDFSSEKRKEEYSISRFLLSFVLNNFYKIENYKIVEINKKPKLENNEIKFSISHSNDFVGICFSNDEIGFDVEKISNRDIEKLAKRYNKKFDNLNDFYKFWTKEEATIKLQNEPVDYLTFEINDYMVSLASIEKINSVKVFELIGENLCIKRLEF